MEHVEFHCLPDSDSTTSVPSDRIVGNPNINWETPVHVEGGPAPNYVQRYISYVQAVPLRLLMQRLGVALVEDLSNPGAQVEALVHGVMGHRAVERGWWCSLGACTQRQVNLLFMCSGPNIMSTTIYRLADLMSTPTNLQSWYLSI